ncbi:MAG: agmatinase [Phycisphaerales bacterium]
MSNFSLSQAVNLAPTGIATFAKTPVCTDLNQLDADIALLGAPCDISIQGRSGARLGPRGIRMQSTRFSYSPRGSYDPERDDFYISTDRWKIVDCGDADLVPGDLEASFANIEAAVRKIIVQGAMPVVMGGDHSITIPVVRGLETEGPFHVIHFDSHLDWTNSRGGQRYSNGSPCRQISLLPYVFKMAHLGIHGIGSSQKSDFEDAKAYGDLILSPRQIRRLGIEETLKFLPQGERYFVTIDIDAMDYSIAAGTGSPMHGGLYYDEMTDLLEGVAKLGHIVGFDLVEVAPPYDNASSTTCYLAARLMSDFIGFITKERERLGEKSR